MYVGSIIYTFLNHSDLFSRKISPYCYKEAHFTKLLQSLKPGLSDKKKSLNR